MEIVGLLVIVILIFVIIFFSLAFTSRTPREDRVTVFQDAKIAEQLGPVITETSVQCGTRQVKISDLIRDCAGPREINCLALSSCTLLNNTLEIIVNETLQKDLEYSLTIKRPNSNDFITNFTTQGCINPRSQNTYPTTIVSRLEHILLSITVCY